MKVVAINGSARGKIGNTQQLIEMVYDAIRSDIPDVETKIIELKGKKINPCLACYRCFANKNEQCIQKDDLNEIIPDLLDADAIILGSPTYFANVSGSMKNFIDRAGLVAIANGHMLKRKIGAPVEAVRRQGACMVYSALNFFFGIQQMIICTSSYWNLSIGLKEGDVQKDAEGRETMKNLGENIAWLLKKISS